jgi:hypothetical protein
MVDRIVEMKLDDWESRRYIQYKCDGTIYKGDSIGQQMNGICDWAEYGNDDE